MVGQCDGGTKDQNRAYVIEDNKLAENAGWDREILVIEFQELVVSDCLDLTVTGFEIPEIDLILEEAKPAPEEKAPLEPDLDREPVTKPGDLWILDKHRIICGNSLHHATYGDLMGTRRAATVFTDPPFNVRIAGHATGNGAIRHRRNLARRMSRLVALPPKTRDNPHQQ